jgi:hypothetical protein
VSDVDDRTGTDGLLRAVSGQAEIWWHGFRTRLIGLTDDEYLWEPAPAAWSLRQDLSGGVTFDHAWPPPAPAPVTTIAWRLCHIAVGCLANRTTALFPSFAPQPVSARPWEGPIDFPYDAAGALDYLDRWWAAWLAGLRNGGAEVLWEPIGEREWDVPQMQLGHSDPAMGLVLHVHRELIHHGAEICLLRDLYPHRHWTWTPTPS